MFSVRKYSDSSLELVDSACTRAIVDVSHPVKFLILMQFDLHQEVKLLC